MSSKKIVIVGAGVTGLVAAIELEKRGYSPIILDKNDVVGGRLATEFYNGVPLDVGFQVLLTAYPEARRYLDYEKLDLKYFLPGAIIHHGEKKILWGDPMRDSMFLNSAIFSTIGTLLDKWNVFTLQKKMKLKSISRIFLKEEKTTAEYLSDYGFSQSIINNFFQPFFAGIYLEEALTTSSRMFEFVFKMFAEGKAAIPANGMQAIAEQLKSQLTQTTFKLGTKVVGFDHEKLSIASGEEVRFDTCIYTTPTEVQKIKWKSCENLYFEVEKQIDDLPIIGLFTHRNRLVNNYHFVTSLLPKSGKSILSVTIIKHHQHTDLDLIDLVKKELETQLGLIDLELIRHYKIPKALPQVVDLKYSPRNLKIENNVIFSGDYTVQGSINSAMLSGKRAAKLVK